MDQRRDRRPLMALAGLAVAGLVVATTATLAVHNAGRSTTAATGSPSSAAPTEEPSASASAPTGSGVPEIGGTASIELGGAIHDRASVPIVCVQSAGGQPVLGRIGPAETTLFGETVTLSWSGDAENGGTMLLSRQSAASYSGQTPAPDNFGYETFAVSLDTSDAGRATPFGGPGGPPSLTVGLVVACDWPPATVVDMSGDSTSFGSAALTVGAESVTVPLNCQWSSGTRVIYYFPASTTRLFGERIDLAMSDASPGHPTLAIARERLAASYAISGTFEAEGWSTARGKLTFSGLAMDPRGYGYPLGQPIPNPTDWFLTPLGGLEANRTLSGSLTWACGQAPAGVPETEPTPEPGQSNPSRMPWPDVSVRATGASAAARPELILCHSGIVMANPDLQDNWDCIPAGRWYVPATEMSARAGSSMTLSVPGYRIASAEMAFATPAEVERWRTGQPDTTVIRKPSAQGKTSVTFQSPPPGDWVVIFTVGGTNSAGDELGANYAIVVHVAS